MYVVCVCYASLLGLQFFFVFFFKQKTAYEMRISDWSSDVCSSDLDQADLHLIGPFVPAGDRKADLRQHFRPRDRAAPAGLAEQEAPFPIADSVAEIGRASCRESVCQYV